MIKKAIVVVWCMLVVGFRALRHPHEMWMELERRFLTAANRRIGRYQDQKAAAFAKLALVSEAILGVWGIFSAHAVLLAYRKRQLISVCVVLFFAIPLTSGIMTANYTVYEYSYHGRVLGVVKDAGQVQSAVRAIEGSIVENEGKKAEATPKDVEVRETLLPLAQTMGNIDTEEDIVNNIVSQEDLDVKAYEVAVNGDTVGVAGSKEDAEAVLAGITDYWLGDTDPASFKEVSFAEDVSVNEVASTLSEVNKSDELFSLAIGQVNMRTVEEGYYTAAIDFETIYEETDELFLSEEEVVEPGVPGTKNAYGEIVRIDGEIVEYIEQSSEVIEDAKPAIVRRGTKPIPPSIGTGAFIVPLDDVLVTSLYGPRWGRIHEGIDFGTPVGTKVKASDGGKVMAVGYDGSFGLTVEIDHGAGFSTLYAHLSKTLVKTGDDVYQGQQIAESGNTGYSTGPHLHFGIYKFGHSEVTMDYLPDDMPLYLLSGVGHD
ncbi:MAG: peptidoglycan DD-metalloendopeptidase family protein [Clostridiales Family XIII bacterium]|jgi:murein DD-endopeptidase MepM/ murein hydrolase activator NlpD|nr:peptidoglycan DD-metalloendopeptidase family protein [Clostridiales Family XIII bacterium]